MSLPIRYVVQRPGPTGRHAARRVDRLIRPHERQKNTLAGYARAHTPFILLGEQRALSRYETYAGGEVRVA